jgi:hypothetical protein
MVTRRRLSVLFERLDRGRHEDHTIEPGLLAAALRNDQVPLVHGVETAAKNPDPHRRSS